jgi:16S rRNA (cytosine1402-N4)-methyltransferase
MVKEVVEWLATVRQGTFVDCTVGLGGHARSLLEKIGPSSKLIGIDADAEALEKARHALAKWKERVILIRDNFRNLGSILHGLGVEEVDGILFDLGMSSAQVDDPSRGFSFYREGPLDMRFDHRQSLTAAEIVNRYAEKEIVRVMREFGEERFAGRIASAIVRRRRESPITSTGELAELIEGVLGRRRGAIHPATRSFQALRIAVNQELKSLGEALPQSIMALKPGGRLLVISYQSLDDRAVKQTFREFEKGCICPPSVPECRCGQVSEVKILTRKPVRPSIEEVQRNPRSRSAKMRVCQRRSKRNADT